MAEQKTILLADDSSFMRGVLKNILTELGYSDFHEANNGKEAVALYKSVNPDLMLLDLIMPEMGGMDVLKEIGGEANVIIVTAVGQESVAEEAKQHGAKGYIVKPFDKNQVVEEVKKALA